MPLKALLKIGTESGNIVGPWHRKIQVLAATHEVKDGQASPVIVALTPQNTHLHCATGVILYAADRRHGLQDPVSWF
jgi:hypothetical protein